jgi:hypothetical protein
VPTKSSRNCISSLPQTARLEFAKDLEHFIEHVFRLEKTEGSLLLPLQIKGTLKRLPQKAHFLSFFMLDEILL